ncbi:MAG: response regulator [Proteobacteria bacterium]|nr:MAG: response regulator [Pseudomonadota bacterium]
MSTSLSDTDVSLRFPTRLYIYAVGGKIMDGEKTVLVVDDNFDFLVLVATILRHSDLTILTAKSAMEAIHTLSESNIDLLITDFNMPGMNGLELIQWCREKGKILPVILATAQCGKFAQIDVQLGDRFACVMGKPFLANVLRRTTLRAI